MPPRPTRRVLEARDKFLAALACCGSLSAASEVSGVSSATWRRLMQDDDDFRWRVDAACIAFAARHAAAIVRGDVKFEAWHAEVVRRRPFRVNHFLKVFGRLLTEQRPVQTSPYGAREVPPSDTRFEPWAVESSASARSL